MLVAYILTETGYLKTKLLIKPGVLSFDYDGVEYIVKRDYLYQKKFAGIKLFFWLFYIQGQQDPVRFTKSGLSVGQLSHINESARLINKLKNTVLDSVAKIGLLITGIVLMVMVMLLIQIANKLGVF